MSDEQASGKVSANIDIKRQSRQETHVKIIIVCADTEATLFRAEYSTDDKGMAAYTVASNIVKEYCEAHDYIADIGTTGFTLPTIRTIKRGNRWL